MTTTNDEPDLHPCSWCGETGKRYGETCDVCDGTGQTPITYR